MKKYQPPQPEIDMDDPIVKVTFETTTMESQKVKKFPSMPCKLVAQNSLPDDGLSMVKENASRKVDRLLNDCPVPAEDWFTAKSTRQYARDIYLLLQYFKFHVTLKQVSEEMMEEMETARDLMPVEPTLPCLSAIRREGTIVLLLVGGFPNHLSASSV
nr:hypothetical protein HmN_000802600 [Hymenolepis microstoma]